MRETKGHSHIILGRVVGRGDVGELGRGGGGGGRRGVAEYKTTGERGIYSVGCQFPCHHGSIHQTRRNIAQFGRSEKGVFPMLDNTAEEGETIQRDTGWEDTDGAKGEGVGGQAHIPKDCGSEEVKTYVTSSGSRSVFSDFFTILL